MKYLLIAIILSSCTTLNLSKKTNTVEEFKLKNGINVIFKKDTSTEVISLRVAFRGGVRLLNNENAGVESLLMDLSLKGTKVYPKEKLNSMFFKYGIGLSSINQPDYSVYKLKTLRKYFPIGLNVINEVIKEPLLEEEEFKIIKAKMLASLKAEEDSPMSMAQKRVKDYFFEAHPYYLREFGRIETVSKININTVKRHHEKMLDASRIFLTVVGDLEMKNLKKDLNNYFGKLPNKNVNIKKHKDFKNAKVPKTIIVNKKDVPQTIIIGLFGAPNYESRDYEPLLIGLDILRDRIVQEIRVKRGLVYSPYTGTSSMHNNFGFLYFATRKPKEAFGEIKKLIEIMKTNMVDNEELNSAKEMFITSYWSENETVTAQGGNLTFFELSAGGYKRYFDHMDRVFKVKPGDINRVMNNYYKNLSFSVVGSTNNLKPGDFVLQ